MAGYKIQLKDKNGNRQYPVSTTNVVVDADGVSVADLLDRKQPTLVSGVNIKTINGKTLLGEGDLVIEGGTADLSGYATTEYVDAKVGESYPIYYSYDGTPLTEEQKAANKMAVDRYAETENVALYPYMSSAVHRFDVMLTLSEGAWKTAELTKCFYIYFNDDGTTMHYVKVTVEQDGDVQVEYSAQSPLVLASKTYVDSKVGGGSSDASYPVHTPLDGQELTEEQKAANKEAYDAVVAASGADSPQMPYLYPYDFGRQFPLLVIDFNAEEGLVGLILNTDLKPVPLSDYGLPILGTGLVSVSKGLNLYSDGRITIEYGDNYISPDISAMQELATASGGGITAETDPVFKASPAAGITAANISAWNNKVDKESGKGLSTNDYTTTEKNKLAGIAEGAEVNVQSDWNATSGDAFIKNKPTIPAAVTESTVSGWGFTKNTGTYSKPSTGIPKSDLASSVQTSLGKADTALQSYTEQYKGTVTGVKVNDSIKSPSNGVVDLGTIPNTIDASMSDSSTNPVQNKTVKAYVDSKVAAAGQMAVLSHGSSETAVELTPNVMHRWTNAVSQLTISLKSVSSAYVQHYMMQFTTSTAGCTLTMPSGIQWASGLAPIMKPDTTYQISIVNYCGVWNYYE